MRKYFSITAFVILSSLFVLVPLSDTAAGGPVHLVEGSVGSYQCVLLTPYLGETAANQSDLHTSTWLTGRGMCSIGYTCVSIAGSASHTFNVTPGAEIKFLGQWGAGFCDGMGVWFRVAPAETCGLILEQWGRYLWSCVAPASGQITVNVAGRGSYTIIASEVEVIEPPSETLPDPDAIAGVQRINRVASIPYVIYVPTAERAAVENIQFIDIWQLDENGVGQPLLLVSAAQLAALPSLPAENLLIVTSPDGLVSVYKLTTGEYQVNIGPLGEGKMYTYIFDGIPPTQINASTWLISTP